MERAKTRARESQLSKAFLADLLGERDWIGVYNDMWAGIKHKAFSAATVESFVTLAVEDKEARPLLRRMLVSERTWKRRKREKTALSAAEVSRIESVGKVVREARRVWGDHRETAEKFLASPHPRLHGETPMKVAATDGGLPAVLELLARIEEGAPV